jgi:hypothetical protein
LLVSSRTHTQPVEKDLENERIEAEGRALQHYLAYDPREARMDSEGEDQCARTHRL